MLEGLCYELCMFGVTLNGPYNIFFDNQAITTSTIHAESRLKKKSANRSPQGSQSGGCMYHLNFCEKNSASLADLFTKILTLCDLSLRYLILIKGSILQHGLYCIIILYCGVGKLLVHHPSSYILCTYKFLVCPW